MEYWGATMESVGTDMLQALYGVVPRYPAPSAANLEKSIDMHVHRVFLASTKRAKMYMFFWKTLEDAPEDVRPSPTVSGRRSF